MKAKTPIKTVTKKSSGKGTVKKAVAPKKMVTLKKIASKKTVSLKKTAAPKAVTLKKTAAPKVAAVKKTSLKKMAQPLAMKKRVLTAHGLKQSTLKKKKS